MTPEMLLEHFDAVADAPNGVQKLRELILQLAVRGKLVPQDPSDEPASVLLERIEAEQQRIQEQAGTPKLRQLSRPKASDVPFQIPDGWEWVRVGGVVGLINGRAFKPAEWSSSGLPIIRIQNLNDPAAPFNYCDFEVKEKFHVADGDLLLSWSGTPGTSFGAFIWNRGAAVLNQHIFRCDLYGNAYYKPFLRLAINSRLDEMIAQAHGGVGLRHITKGKLERLAIPLPPRTEQRRVVEQVEHLFALCDELKERQHRRVQKRDRLNKAALHRLTTASDDTEVAEHWQRVRDHFGLLYDAPESVGELRQSILQLAVRGKLVPQDKADESSITPEDPDIGDGKPSRGESFALPAEWKCVNLRDVISFGPRNGFSPKPVDYPTNVKSLTLSATTSGRFDPRHFKYVDVEVECGSYLWLEPEDILIQRGNSLEYVGTAAIYAGKRGEFIYPDLMMKIRAASQIDPRYLVLGSV